MVKRQLNIYLVPTKISEYESYMKQNLTAAPILKTIAKEWAK